MPDQEFLIEEKPATPDEAKRIKQLIGELARIDAPGVGYSSSLSGDAFAPLPELDWWGMRTWIWHGVRHSDTLEKLVMLGPKALPFLLESLDDKTPTQLILRSTEYDKPWTVVGGMGPYGKPLAVAGAVGEFAIWLDIQPINKPGPMHPAREIIYNPLNTAEARALKNADVVLMTGVGDAWGEPKAKLATTHIKDECQYNLTVGDMCLVAVGQITNRPYPAARYQPTGLTYISSSAHDPEIAKAVRSVWLKKAYRRQLFDSLMIDFHTRGDSGRLQLGAATRLVYYFPDEAGPVLAQRLHDLNVRSDLDQQGTDSVEANGTRPDELLKSVAFTKNKDVRREVLDVFRRTVDLEIALAALPAIDEEHRAEVLAKLELFLKAIPKKEERVESEGYKLLMAAGKHLGQDRATFTLFNKYLDHASAQRRTTVCRVLREEWGKPLAVHMLASWLEDKSDAVGGKYDPTGVMLFGSGKHRICDEAASTLACHLDKVSFDGEAKLADRDRQIVIIRNALSAKKGRP